ncbi:hypothetical protein V1264_021781 [Littorina saxatilis]|uniref:C2H2-type domain-containing protein n=1 Tax=Littorina saxatilis TaxID=31220 RepID=A0AAN9AIX8_9CAEN
MDLDVTGDFTLILSDSESVDVDLTQEDTVNDGIIVSESGRTPHADVKVSAYKAPANLSSSESSKHLTSRPKTWKFKRLSANPTHLSDFTVSEQNTTHQNDLQEPYDQVPSAVSKGIQKVLKVPVIVGTHVSVSQIPKEQDPLVTNKASEIPQKRVSLADAINSNTGKPATEAKYVYRIRLEGKSQEVPQKRAIANLKQPMQNSECSTVSLLFQRTSDRQVTLGDSRQKHQSVITEGDNNALKMSHATIQTPGQNRHDISNARITPAEPETRNTQQAECPMVVTPLPQAAHEQCRHKRSKSRIDEDTSERSSEVLKRARLRSINLPCQNWPGLHEIILNPNKRLEQNMAYTQNSETSSVGYPSLQILGSQEPGRRLGTCVSPEAIVVEERGGSVKQRESAVSVNYKNAEATIPSGSRLTSTKFNMAARFHHPRPITIERANVAPAGQGFPMAQLANTQSAVGHAGSGVADGQLTTLAQPASEVKVRLDECGHTAAWTEGTILASLFRHPGFQQKDTHSEKIEQSGDLHTSRSSVSRYTGDSSSQPDDKDVMQQSYILQYAIKEQQYPHSVTSQPEGPNTAENYFEKKVLGSADNPCVVSDDEQTNEPSAPKKCVQMSVKNTLRQQGISRGKTTVYRHQSRKQYLSEETHGIRWSLKKKRCVPSKPNEEETKTCRPPITEENQIQNLPRLALTGLFGNRKTDSVVSDNKKSAHISSRYGSDVNCQVSVTIQEQDLLGNSSDVQRALKNLVTRRQGLSNERTTEHENTLNTTASAANVRCNAPGVADLPTHVQSKTNAAAQDKNEGATAAKNDRNAIDVEKKSALGSSKSDMTTSAHNVDSEKDEKDVPARIKTEACTAHLEIDNEKDRGCYVPVHLTSQKTITTSETEENEEAETLPIHFCLDMNGNNSLELPTEQLWISESETETLERPDTLTQDRWPMGSWSSDSILKRDRPSQRQKRKSDPLCFVGLQTISFSGIKPFQCGICFAKFDDCQMLTLHHIKSDRKKNTCVGRGESNSGNVSSEAADTGFPYRCAICCADFQLSAHLVRHVRTMHSRNLHQLQSSSCKDEGSCEDINDRLPVTKNTSKKSRLFACPECHAILIGEKSILDHMNFLHGLIPSRRQLFQELCRKTLQDALGNYQQRHDQPSQPIDERPVLSAYRESALTSPPDPLRPRCHQGPLPSPWELALPSAPFDYAMPPSVRFDHQASPSTRSDHVTHGFAQFDHATPPCVRVGYVTPASVRIEYMTPPARFGQVVPTSARIHYATSTVAQSDDPTTPTERFEHVTPRSAQFYDVTPPSARFTHVTRSSSFLPDVPPLPQYSRLDDLQATASGIQCTALPLLEGASSLHTRGQSALPHHKCSFCEQYEENWSSRKKQFSAAYLDLACKTCGDKFVTPTQLRCHVRDDHTQYKCSHCPRRYRGYYDQAFRGEL